MRPVDWPSERPPSPMPCLNSSAQPWSDIVGRRTPTEPAEDSKMIFPRASPFFSLWHSWRVSCLIPRLFIPFPPHRNLPSRPSFRSLCASLSHRRHSLYTVRRSLVAPFSRPALLNSAPFFYFCSRSSTVVSVLQAARPKRCRGFVHSPGPLDPPRRRRHSTSFFFSFSRWKAFFFAVLVCRQMVMKSC